MGIRDHYVNDIEAYDAGIIYRITYWLIRTLYALSTGWYNRKSSLLNYTDIQFIEDKQKYIQNIQRQHHHSMYDKSDRQCAYTTN